MQPMLHLQRGDRVLRQQPPYRVRACKPPKFVQGDRCGEGGDQCDGPLAECKSCHWPYCALHVAGHVERVVFPVDSWRTTRKEIWRRADRIAAGDHRGNLWDLPDRRLTELRLADKLLDPDPPVRIEYCIPPSSGKVLLPCTFACATCEGEPTRCDECGFTRCAKHAPIHRRSIALPRKVWNRIKGSFERQLELAVQFPKRGIRVRPPRFEVH